MALTALALNCTLKAEGESSTDRMIKLVADALAKQHVSLTVPAAAATYWVGEAMQKKDFKDLSEVPGVIVDTAKMAAANAAHVAGLLNSEAYSGC